MIVMPVDPSTLDSSTPRTLDGRPYPDHLRAYEQRDLQLLPLLGDGEPHTFDGLSLQIVDPRARSALPRWIASATWRGLVTRMRDSNDGPTAYVITDRGRSRL
jgi:hypothetical protein